MLALAGDDQNLIETFAIATDGGPLMIPLHIKTEDSSFVLDTGAAISVFDPAVAPAFNLTNRFAKVNGMPRLPVWRCRRAYLGHRNVPVLCRAVCIEMEDFGIACGREVRGILGIEFLRAQTHVVQFDFDGGHVSFLKSSDGVAGEKIYLEFDPRNPDDCPSIAIEFPGVDRIPFVLDTGSVGAEVATLSTATFNQLLSAKQLSIAAGKARTLAIGGVIEGRSGFLKELRIGPFNRGDCLIREGASDALGLGFLSRFKVTLDFAKHCVILDRGKRYSKSVPANRLGVDVEIKDGVGLFSEVEHNSVAFLCGIRPGDHLISVNDKPVGDMSCSDFADFIHRAPNGSRMQIATPPSLEMREVQIDGARAQYNRK